MLKKEFICIGALGWRLTILLIFVSSARADFHISPKGRDTNPGTKRSPFATLERARDAVRDLRRGSELPGGGLTVWIHKGDFALTNSFTLTSLDSGAPNQPVCYRAIDSKVRLLGGRVIPGRAFGKINDRAVVSRLDPAARDQVLVADLSSLGLRDLGTFPDKFSGAALLPEVFFNDVRMTLARWPNEGWAEITKVIESGPAEWRKHTSDKRGQFQFNSDRIERWHQSPAVWLSGYWCFDWANETIRVGEIDPQQHRITLSQDHVYGLGSGNKGSRRFIAINLIEELDSPGEYFVDRQAGRLYFWPPGSIRKGQTVISTLNQPVISMNGVSNVILRGLTVMDCVGTGILMKDGRDNQIVACRVSNTGMDGIVVDGGEKHLVMACDISNNGTAGLRISGGDRPTLTPSGHQAVNNHIHHVSCRQRTAAGHVHVGGVGVRVANNLIHGGPHQAVWLSGNDHLIELNEIHHTGMETDDCGAFYMGRNPSERGSVLRHNFWHDIGSARAHGSCAVYFDDGSGGQTVFGNIFYRAAGGNFGAVFVHGGHDNVAVNNIFVDCPLAFGHAPWADPMWKEWLTGDLWQTRLRKEVDITRPPFTDRYPALRGFLEFSGAPRANYASNNVIVNCARVTTGQWLNNGDFVTGNDPGFVNAKAMDFRLRDDSAIFTNIPQFQPIPFERIGLVRDALRKEVERD